MMMTMMLLLCDEGDDAEGEGEDKKEDVILGYEGDEDEGEEEEEDIGDVLYGYEGHLWDPLTP